MSGRLRSYARLNRRSPTVEAGEEAFAAVYREVDDRSEGRCEVTRIDATLGADGNLPPWRCSRRATAHHHLFKPRRAHHTALEVVAVCPDCHDRMEWPYSRGRLCFLGRVAVGPRDEFRFALRFASDKFAARRQA